LTTVKENAGSLKNGVGAGAFFPTNRAGIFFKRTLIS